MLVGLLDMEMEWLQMSTRKRNGEVICTSLVYVHVISLLIIFWFNILPSLFLVCGQADTCTS